MDNIWPQAGRKYYVRLPGGTSLVRLEVIEVTNKTVEVRHGIYISTRYKIEDIEFVEEVK